MQTLLGAPGGREVKRLPSSRCLGGDADGGGLGRRFLGAETLRGACELTPRALHSRGDGRIIPHSARSALGGCGPPGLGRGLPRGLPTTPGTAPGSGGPPCPLA